MPISVSKFSYFLVQILCFTNEEIEAQGLGGLSDFFNSPCQKKHNKKKKSKTSQYLIQCILSYTTLPLVVLELQKFDLLLN